MEYYVKYYVKMFWKVIVVNRVKENTEKKIIDLRLIPKAIILYYWYEDIIKNCNVHFTWLCRIQNIVKFSDSFGGRESTHILETK